MCCATRCTAIATLTGGCAGVVAGVTYMGIEKSSVDGLAH